MSAPSDHRPRATFGLNLPPSRWPVWLIALAASLGFPITAAVYYPALLGSGVLDPAADSISIPLGESLLAAVVITPTILAVTGAALRRYPARASLTAWNAARPIVSAVLSMLFLAPAAITFASIVGMLVTPSATYLLDLLWLPHEAALVAWCIVARAAAVARRSAAALAERGP